MGALNGLHLLLMTLMMLLLHSNELTLMPMLALPIPPLNLLASMQARQDADEGNAAARASLPPQRHITTRIMHQWPQHQQTAANPPSRRAQEVHQLHCPQSVPTLAEDSALRRNMPQRNDESEDALKQHRISF